MSIHSNEGDIVYLVVEDSLIDYEGYDNRFRGVFASREKAEQLKTYLEKKEGCCGWTRFRIVVETIG